MGGSAWETARTPRCPPESQVPHIRRNGRKRLGDCKNTALPSRISSASHTPEWEEALGRLQEHRAALQNLKCLTYAGMGGSAWETARTPRCPPESQVPLSGQ